MIEHMREKAERIAAIDEEIAALKAERTALEGEFLAEAESDLRDTKRKTAIYRGDGIKVTATMADTVKLVYPALLRMYPVYEDMVREEKAYKLTEPGKRLLSGICRRSYIKSTVEEVLRQSAPADKLPQLLKKVQGKVYATDVRNLKAILGCSDEEADSIAYLVAEAAIWQEFELLCRAHKVDGEERDELIDTIGNAVIVEEAPKIRAERS